MPIIEKVPFNSDYDLYKNYMNEKYDVELLFNFYWKNFIDDSKIFQNHPLIGKRLTKFSQEYFLLKDKKGNAEFKNILYKKLIPLESSSDNILFTKFMKFHFGFLKFSQWYKPNGFAKLEVNEIIMKDFITRDLMLCLEKNNKKLKDKLNTLNDFQLVSNICIKERLTLYNFLCENEINTNEAKDFINKLYMKTFRGKAYSPEFKENIKNIKIEDLLNIYSKEKNI